MRRRQEVGKREGGGSRKGPQLVRRSRQCTAAFFCRYLPAGRRHVRAGGRPQAGSECRGHADERSSVRGAIREVVGCGARVARRLSDGTLHGTLSQQAASPFASSDFRRPAVTFSVFLFHKSQSTCMHITVQCPPGPVYHVQYRRSGELLRVRVLVLDGIRLPAWPAAV